MSRPPHSTISDARPLRLVFAGRVDYGKSTMIARLLAEVGHLPEGRIEEIQAASFRRGTGFEWSYVLDALQAERDQAVTIEMTRIQLQLSGRSFTLMDVPGHRRFLRNAVVGLADADAAVVLADAAEDPRQLQEVLNHLAFFGTANVIVAVNKMDGIGRSHDRFGRIEEDIVDQLAQGGLRPRAIIPIVARTGENLVHRSSEMTWYVGPTLLEAITALPPITAMDAAAPLRFPVQDVYRRDGKRFLAGRVESGRLKAGDRVVFTPSRQEAEVACIRVWDEPDPDTVEAGRSCALLLREDIFVERGEMASHRHDQPMTSDHATLALLFPDGDRPLVGQPYRLRAGTASVGVEVLTADPKPPADTTWRITVRCERPIALDEQSTGLPSSRCLLLDRAGPIAAGFVVPQAAAGNDAPQTDPIRLVDRATREARNGHRGAVLWMTGLPGAGKSTLSALLERRLFDNGIATCVLDGDVLRHGLSADLGFSAADRAENIRRVAEVAALLADNGLVAIVALVSPFAADRAHARRIVGDDFHEVFVDADLEICEQRDPKGLYRLARAGRIADFTGVSSPYEAPRAPQLVLKTALRTAEECLEALAAYALSAAGKPAERSSRS